jgi:hypothetical protein
MAQACPFCNNPVDSGVFQCPHCGRVQYKIRCSRCGSWSFANSTTCRACHGPFTAEDQARRFAIEPNDSFMMDVAPTMAPIPRRPGAPAAQPAPPPPQPQAPPVVVVQPQASPLPAAPQPQVLVVDRPGYVREKSYLGEAFLTLALYWIGLFIAGLIANIIFLGNARRDRQWGVITTNVGCLQALLWFHIIGLIVGCVAFIAFNGFAFMMALLSSL